MTFSLRTLICACLLTILAAWPAHALADSPRLVQHTLEDGSVTVEITFDVGVDDVFKISTGDGDERRVRRHSASPTLGVTPAFDIKLNDYVAVGAEMLLAWIAPEDLDGRRLAFSPHGRLRFAFPVSESVSLGAMASAGFAFWGDAEESGDGQLNAFRDSRLGFSVRLGVDAGYVVTDTMALFARIGYFTAVTFGQELTARYDTVLFTAGARFGF